MLAVKQAMRDLAKDGDNLLDVTVGSERQVEDYFISEQSVPSIYAVLPGKVILKLKDLTSVVR